MERLITLAVGGDYDVTVEFPLPLSDYENVAVWFVDRKCNEFKYSLKELEGHNSDDVAENATNAITIKLQKSVTSQMAAGVVTIETYEAIDDDEREQAHFAEIATPAVFAEFKRNRIFRAWR